MSKWCTYGGACMCGALCSPGFSTVGAGISKTFSSGFGVAIRSSVFKGGVGDTSDFGPLLDLLREVGGSNRMGVRIGSVSLSVSVAFFVGLVDGLAAVSVFAGPGMSGFFSPAFAGDFTSFAITEASVLSCEESPGGGGSFDGKGS